VKQQRILIVNIDYRESIIKGMCDPRGDQLVYIVYILLAILGSVALIELAFVLYQLSKLLDIIAKYYKKKAESS
jgi:hypothetical protein